jgi:hypothetical protein
LKATPTRFVVARTFWNLGGANQAVNAGVY